MEPHQTNTDNFMRLMRNWYSQSNDLIKFMMESFTESTDLKGDIKGKAGTDPASKSTRENLWAGYLKNMESVLNEYGTSNIVNQQMMENLVNKWKEYQTSMTEYFNMFGMTDGEGVENSTADIWTKWLEYSTTMNSQMLKTFYNINGKSAEDVKDGAFEKELFGKPIFTGPGTDTISNLDNKSINEMENVINSYYSQLSKELMSTYESVLFQKTNSVEGAQEFITKWSSFYNQFIKDLINTPGYNMILNDNLKAGLRARSQLDESFESHWKLLGLPTRADVMELHRELHDMQLKLNRFSKHLDELDAGTDRKNHR